MMKALVETGFLIALNPDDKHHKWALNILKQAKEGEILLYISPAAPIELSLILRSKGVSEEMISKSLEALHIIITRYIKPKYPQLTLNHLSKAAVLRKKYPQLTLFDSIHLATAITEKLVYLDRDETLKDIYKKEIE